MDSDAVNPASSALVESANSSRMPLVCASSPIRARSVRRPSTGARSILKSPEWSTTPWGVWKAIAIADGTEWVTGMNSTGHSPIMTVSLSATSMNVAFFDCPASRTRCAASPTVSADP